MSIRKCYFLPPHLSINTLASVLTGVAGSSSLTHKACLLYTLLCQDLIRLRLRREPAGYTQLHRDDLFTLFNNQYRQVVDLLLANDLLQVNEVDGLTGQMWQKEAYSKVEGVARAYRIPAHLRAPDKLFARVPIMPDKIIMNTLDRLNHVTRDPTQIADFYRHAVRQNVSKLVLLDDTKTRSLVETRFERLGLPYSDYMAEAIIARFNESAVLRAKICEFAGRLHPDKLREPKALRGQMRFEDCLDEPLVEIDLVSSQPWFLSIVTPQLIKRFAPECQDAIPFFKEVEGYADVVAFREKCGNAAPERGIYDHLAILWNKNYGENFTRDQAKAICYRAFFSDYAAKEQTTVAQRQKAVIFYQTRLVSAQRKHGIQVVLGTKEEQAVAVAALKKAELRFKKAESKLFTQKCYELFREEFPGMHKLFTNIKRLKWDFPRGQQPGEQVKYYANNALLAQRIESNVVFGVVVRALLEAGVSYCFTIHDAFVVRQRDEARARKIIKKAFASVGLKPNLK